VHLSNLFGDNLGTIFDYSNIVIFNCPSKLETNDDIFSIINKMIADTEEQLPTSDSEDSDEELNPALQELENHLRFYKAITSHRDQVFLLDDNENNETRKKFLSSLVTLKPIKPEMINFDAFYRPILEKIEFNIHEFVSDMSDKIQENKFQPMLSSSVMTNEISDYICHENEIYVYYIKPNELYSSLHVFMTDNKFHLLSFTHQNNAHLLEKNYRLLFNNSHPLSTINASRDKDSYVQHRPLFDNETEMFSKITENITIMHKKCKDFITNNEWLIHNKKFLETFIKLINATIDSPKSYGGVIGGMTIDNIRKVLLYQLSELKRIEINFCASTDLTARAANEFMPKPPSPTTTPTNLPDELSKN
jgi:hypothetical protein